MIRFPFSTLIRTFPPGAANGDNARLPARARMAIKLDIVFITFASFTNSGTLGFPRAGGYTSDFCIITCLYIIGLATTQVKKIVYFRCHPHVLFDIGEVIILSDAIQLPDAPGIPGLRFRHFRGGDDFNHMATITRVSAEVDDTERADTPEELEKLYEHLTNCDPYTDMIFAEVDPGNGR